MANATSQVTINPNSYVQLVTSGPALLSPGRYQIIFAASQPANNALGHSMAYSTQPFYVPFATSGPIWAQAIDATQTSVTVTA